MSDLSEAMTPAEIEREYGMSDGTVRQYLSRHEKDMAARGVMRRPDKRTILILKSEVRKIWGNPKD